MNAYGRRRPSCWPRLAPRRAIRSVPRFGCSPPGSMLSTRPPARVTLLMRSTPKYLLHARPFGQLDRASAARRTVERSLGLRPPGAHRPVGFVGGLEVKGLYSGRQSHSVFYWMSIHILLTDNKR